jgi:ribosomal protein L32
MNYNYISFFTVMCTVHPAVAVDICTPPAVCDRAHNDSSASDAKSIIDSIFDGFFHAAVPKYRRSRERIAIRRFGQHRIRDFMTPRQNLVECLTCGSWHEAHTICGLCTCLITKLSVPVTKNPLYM